MAAASDPVSLIQNKIASLSVDDFEIYFTSAHRYSVEVKEGKVDALQEAVEKGLALRLFQKGRSSFAATSAFDASSLERMILLSHQGLKISDETGTVSLPGPRSPITPPAGGLDPSLRGISGEEKSRQALSMEEAARKFDQRVVRVRGCRYEEGQLDVTIRNSRGLADAYSKTLCELSLMVVAEEKGKQESSWEEQASPVFSRLDPSGVGRRAAEKAVGLLGAKPIPTAKVPAVLDPVVGASLLGVLASSFLADQVQKNRSALRGKLGQEIYAATCSIVDDATLKDGVASAPFDGEGVATRRLEIVRQGRLESFLYDLRAAGREKRGSTGHGNRPHYKETPHVGPSNLFFQPGAGGEEELFREMGRGFWIWDLIGVHTADPVTGDFSLGATGAWIENGKVAFPVRGVAVSGNLHELLKKITRMGADLRFYRNFGSPSILISEIDVGGA